MTSAPPVRKPYVEPAVSAPIDALDSTRVFGGLLGQVVLGGGSSGTALDDGDYNYSCSGDTYCDTPGQDAGVDGYGSSL